MRINTKDLPSGYQYGFDSIELKPMKFKEILDYVETVRDDDLDRFFDEYNLVKADDPNIDNLLLCDLDYVIFLKKGITIHEDIEFEFKYECQECHHLIPIKFKVSDTRFKPLDSRLISQQVNVKFHNSYHRVMMPTVGQFMQIFPKYKRYRRLTDMRLIRLISLFPNAITYLNMYEDYVVNATYEDITMLTLLEDIYFNNVEPLKLICVNCYNTYEPEGADDLDADKIHELKLEHGGRTVSVKDLSVNFFREIYENNQLDNQAIIFGALR